MIIDGEKIDTLASTIESFNLIHMDSQWARADTPFPNRIAHGFLTSSLMSRPLVEFCERGNLPTVLVSSSSKYASAVIVGDTITSVIHVTETIEAKRRIRFEVESTNQYGETVMIGELLEQLL